MRSFVLVLLLLSAACVPMAASATEARDSPGCLTDSIGNLASTVDIDPGVCVIVDLGALAPGDVFEIELVILDDALDVLFFNENTIQPYELGQSYRSIMEQPASTESALGGFEFHWAVPPSIQSKNWYMVLDNLAHDGDAGAGDGSETTTIVVPDAEPTSVANADDARVTIKAIDKAIMTVNIQRSELGAVSNRLSHTVNNLTNISSNLSAAQGGIEDADFAHETTMLAKNQILQQASTAMLAQANASKQNVLSLLQG